MTHYVVPESYITLYVNYTSVFKKGHHFECHRTITPKSHTPGMSDLILRVSRSLENSPQLYLNRILSHWNIWTSKVDGAITLFFLYKETIKLYCHSDIKEISLFFNGRVHYIVFHLIKMTHYKATTVDRNILGSMT